MTDASHIAGLVEKLTSGKIACEGALGRTLAMRPMTFAEHRDAEREAADTLSQLMQERSWRDMWIVVNIGCIECGVSSNIVGVFDDKVRADELAESLNGSHDWREGGQNEFAVFAMPAPNEVASEYLPDPPQAPKDG